MPLHTTEQITVIELVKAGHPDMTPELSKFVTHVWVREEDSYRILTGLKNISECSGQPVAIQQETSY